MHPTDQNAWQLCVAPMMRYTDRHCRVFHRLVAPNARLYTEMVSTDALLNGDRDRLLKHSSREYPVALQLGGRDADDLSRASEIGSLAGFDEINLNVGCPSERVQAGGIGACLMLEPDHVAAAVRAMSVATDIPVTVKCRLGVDGHDDYDFARRFVATVAEAGVETFIVHARIAILKGLSPAENREIPPLRYQCVERLANDFPTLNFVLNGGIRTLADIDSARGRHAGLMIGRAAYHDPVFLAEAAAVLSNRARPALAEIVGNYRAYIVRELEGGTRLAPLIRPILGLAKGRPGAKRFRYGLTEGSRHPAAKIEILDRSLEYIDWDADISVAA